MALTLQFINLLVALTVFGCCCAAPVHLRESDPLNKTELNTWNLTRPAGNTQTPALQTPKQLQVKGDSAFNHTMKEKLATSQSRKLDAFALNATKVFNGSNNHEANNHTRFGEPNTNSTTKNLRKVRALQNSEIELKHTSGSKNNDSYEVSQNNKNVKDKLMNRTSLDIAAGKVDGTKATNSSGIKSPVENETRTKSNETRLPVHSKSNGTITDGVHALTKSNIQSRRKINASAEEFAHGNQYEKGAIPNFSRRQARDVSKGTEAKIENGKPSQNATKENSKFNKTAFRGDVKLNHSGEIDSKMINTNKIYIDRGRNDSRLSHFTTMSNQTISNDVINASQIGRSNNLKSNQSIPISNGNRTSGHRTANAKIYRTHNSTVINPTNLKKHSMINGDDLKNTPRPSHDMTKSGQTYKSEEGVKNKTHNSTKEAPRSGSTKEVSSMADLKEGQKHVPNGARDIHK